MGSTDRAASIVTALREIRHEIKAPIKGRGQTLSPDPALFILSGEDDDVFIMLVITGQTQKRERGGREIGREIGEKKENLCPLSAVPLTCHHLYCQGPSARLAPS